MTHPIKTYSTLKKGYLSIYLYSALFITTFTWATINIKEIITATQKM